MIEEILRYLLPYILSTVAMKGVGSLMKEKGTIPAKAAKIGQTMTKETITPSGEHSTYTYTEPTVPGTPAIEKPLGKVGSAIGGVGSVLASILPIIGMGALGGAAKEAGNIGAAAAQGATAIPAAIADTPQQINEWGKTPLDIIAAASQGAALPVAAAAQGAGNTLSDTINDAKDFMKFRFVQQAINQGLGRLTDYNALTPSAARVVSALAPGQNYNVARMTGAVKR
jgi:hypothetical protein